MLKFPIAQLKCNGVLKSREFTVQLTNSLFVWANNSIMVFISLLQKKKGFISTFCGYEREIDFPYLTTDSISCCPMDTVVFNGCKNSLASYFRLTQFSFSSRDDVGTIK